MTDRIQDSASRRRHRRLWFRVVAGTVTLVLAAALVPVFALWNARREMTTDAAAYWEFNRTPGKGRRTVPWPEYPGGSMVLGERHPHFRRPFDSVSTSTRRSGAASILVLGDSHVEGYVPTRENMTALLDEALSPTQVINGGVCGGGVVSAFDFYDKHLKDRHFDGVVFVCYCGNDAWDTLRPTGTHIERDGAGGWKMASWRPLPEPYMEAQFALYAAGLPWKWCSSPAQQRGVLLRSLVGYAPGAIDQWLAQSVYFRTEPQDLDLALQGAAGVLGQLASLAAQRGAQFHLVLLPSKRMAEPETVAGVVSEVRRRLKLPDEYLALDERVHAEMLAAARRHNIPHTDLLDAMRAAHRRDPARPLFWRVDWHLATYGHAVVAGTLRPVLEAMAGSGN